ncbi:hypothetical protein MTO96_036833 [Rhipicephalus appendiculatus]
MNPMEDDMSSTALGPAVPTTEGTLAEAVGAPVSSNIPPRQPLPSEFDVEDAPTQPQQSSTVAGLLMPDCLQALVSQGEADRRALMQKFDTRFASRLLSLETMLAQRTSTADDVVADLAARVSVIEAQSSRQQRVSTSVEQNVRMLAQSRFFRAQLPPPTFDGATSWTAFLVQFESVAALNGWIVQDKAQVLVVQLRAAAAEYLELPQESFFGLNITAHHRPDDTSTAELLRKARFRAHLAIAHHQAKFRSPSDENYTPFKPGDLVLLRRTQRVPQRCQKFLPRFAGPFRVVKALLRSAWKLFQNWAPKAETVFFPPMQDS